MFSYSLLCNLRDFYLILIVSFIELKLFAEGVILCIIIGNVHQFIDHFLIPLDPCHAIMYTQLFIYL